jgi:hypothetical protein
LGLFTITAATASADERTAVETIFLGLTDPELKAVLLFVSSGYDLDRLAGGLRKRFSVPVFGCTTAGHIGSTGYTARGVQAIGLCGSSVSVHTRLIYPLAQCQAEVYKFAQELDALPTRPGASRFALLLVDGLSLMEERLAASLHHCIPEIPLVGGSAGDDLSFQGTHVYADGRFLSDAAVVAVIETEAPFRAFKFQHFVPTDELLVVTEANAETRTVREINGEPAASHFAQRLGLKVCQLSSEIYSRFPVMLSLGSEAYVRSIQKCNPDLSLTFYCAITGGVVMRLGEATDPLEVAERVFANVHALQPEPSLIIGCECVLRRLEFEHSGMDGEMGDLLRQYNIIGFSTYGEQYNALHMNQTFTGLAIGAC